jgi:hypothetical protein
MIGLQAQRAAQLAAAGGLPVTPAPGLSLLQAPLPDEYAQYLQQGVAPTPQQMAPPVTPAPDAAGRHAELLRVAKGINDITLLARIPLMLGSSAFIEDPAEREDLMNVLDAVQMASGAPLLGDKARAGAYTLKHSPDTGAAMRAVGTNVGTEAALQSIPILSTILSSILK